MYPKLDRVKELAAEGKYRRIPVCQEILSDSYTPIEVMRRLREVSRQVYLLESAGQSENWGRYTFLGYEPSLEITCRDGRVVIKKTDALGKKLLEQREVLHPGEVIREIIAQNKTPIMENMPSFTGGLVGYFSYDYIKYSEPKLHLSSGEEDDFNDMDLMLFDRVIAFDNFKQKIYLIAGVYTEELEASYEMAKDKIEEMARVIKYGDKKVFQPLELLSDITPQFTADEYADMVKKAKHYIHEGDIFQVVLSNPLRAKARGSLFDTYRILRSSNPSPYMFYFSSDDIEIAGASPETLVKVVDGKASTFPLAGTRPRGKDEAEDKALEQELLADEKELAEHNMLVDLGRNDMGKISEIGTVLVEEYMGIQRYSHVMHIGSTVVGKIRLDKDSVDAVDAILPAGTLSGAPKFRACEIIQELEQSQRGIYGGAIGYLDFAGNLDVCIAIRLVYKKNDSICIRSGAGIVNDSDPYKEAQECVNKAMAVVDAVKSVEGGLG
ncbi:MAG: anthranilate synthase component I [Lachnospiraceae bacterium]|nr:anthranilate synthase component I [Lachnospiraceae bacterium]MDD6191504.1 anthranilate synthase component I [Lachnospiraceae bacterium]